MGELDGAGSATSLLWLLSVGAGEGGCCGVFVSGVGVEVWAFVVSSSLVSLSAFLVCENKEGQELAECSRGKVI